MKQYEKLEKRYLLGIIGYPLSFTLSPLMHEAALKTLKLPWRYLRLPVSPVDLPLALDGIRALPFIGVNVTVPYKEKVVQYLDKLEGDAKILSTVNVITVRNKKLIGYNSDSLGIYQTIKHLLPVTVKQKIQKQAVLLIGAGGAARACVLALKRLGVRNLFVANRTTKKGEAFIDFCKGALDFFDAQFIPLEKINKAFAVKQKITRIISAVPAEAINRYLLHQLVSFENIQLICELAYTRKPTPLEKFCRKSQFTTFVSGREVLLYQGAVAFEQWTGKKSPIIIMRNTLQ